MKNNYLNTISSERDLITYKKYLHEFPKLNKKEPDTFLECLKNNLGKAVLTQSQIGNTLKTYNGILKSVGNDYILLQQFKGTKKFLISAQNLKFVTFYS